MAVNFLDEILVKLNGTSSSKKYLQLNGGGGSGSVSGQAGIGFRPLNAGSNVHASIEALENGNASYQTNLTFNTNGSSSDSAPTERMRITSAGNVGIGTTSPIAYSGYNALTVDGASGAVLRLDRTDNTNQFEIAVTSSNTYIKNINSKDLWFGTTNAERMRITSTGNVGIGTTSPSQKLEVIGSTKITQSGGALSINSSDANGSYATWQNNGSNIGYIGAGYHLWSSPNNIATSLGIRAQTRLDLGIQSSVHMTILNSGNVGVGTTSPSKKLDVNGDVTFGTGNKFQTIVNALEGVGANGVYLRSAISSAANPSFSNSDDTNTGMFLPGSDVLGLSTAGSERFRITSAGNVGIGTTSPSQKLEVSGKAKITTSLAVGAITPSATTGRIDASNDVVAFSTSDIRLKDNIKSIDKALDKVNSIQGIEFDWIEKEEVHGNSGHDIGVIAQEVEKILPDVVTTRDNGYKAVKYEKIVPLLIEAIKDLSKQVDGLKRLI